MKNVWNIKEEHFKTKKTIEEKLKFFLEYAILAPSGYNSQPWKFEIEGNSIKIWTDLSKTKKVIDPENRESYISTGTAIGNLIMAAKYFGYEANIKINKKIAKKNDLDLSARIRFIEKEIDTDKNNKKMFKAITKRQTNRSEYKDENALKKEDINKIKNYKTSNGISFKLFEQKNIKKKLGAIVADAGVFWYKRQDFRNELMSWLSDDRNTKGDNVWQKFFGEESDVVTMAEEKAIRDEMLVNQALAIMVIGSNSDKKTDWIWTGIELEKILLKLTAMDIQNSYFNTVVQSERHRNKLKSELGNGFVPQLFLRLGKAKKTARSTRREIKEFLV